MSPTSLLAALQNASHRYLRGDAHSLARLQVDLRGLVKRDEGRAALFAWLNDPLSFYSPALSLARWSYNYLRIGYPETMALLSAAVLCRNCGGYRSCDFIVMLVLFGAISQANAARWVKKLEARGYTYKEGRTYKLTQFGQEQASKLLEKADQVHKIKAVVLDALADYK